MSISPRIKGVLIAFIIGIAGNAAWDAIKAGWRLQPVVPAFSFGFFKFGDLVYSVLIASIGVYLGSRFVRPGPAPRIIPLRYGKFDDGVHKVDGRWCKPDGTPFTIAETLIGRQVGTYGLFVRNTGEDAFDVRPSNIKLGTSVLKFESDKSRLSKEDGEEFFPAFIESPHGNSFGNGLFDKMKEQEKDFINVEISYKDADNRWYRTLGGIERDVLATGGLTVRYERRENIQKPRAE